MNSVFCAKWRLFENEPEKPAAGPTQSRSLVWEPETFKGSTGPNTPLPRDRSMGYNCDGFGTDRTNLE
jgi:hypothetical protein